MRVLVADDSAVARQWLTAILEVDPQIVVVGEARDGAEAVELARRLRPNLITMDVHMPGLDGYGAVQEIMASQPTPILVVTALPLRNGEVAARMLAVGALDVVEKPSFLASSREDFAGERWRRELTTKVRLLSQVRVVTHLAGRQRTLARGPQPPIAASNPAAAVIGVVASTGGPPALLTILRSLPADFAGALLVVQHIARGFTSGLVEWLRGSSLLEVKLAEVGDALPAGRVLIAPDDRHLCVGNSRQVELDQSPPVMSLRPCGDVLLQSLAERLGPLAIGVVLTGMGEDGARGIRAIRDAGGRTLVQDEATSAIFGMPRAAIATGAVAEVLPIDAIGDRLLRLVGRTGRLAGGSAGGS
ncbi:MAG: chemotaxis-specific protein-glutamate methyltransferase CheB [Chloroflexi bacterium]|nr:chemotaxis-specific protein-glutamate methyltransferase CheB [Chloroflexota bacterium]